MQKLDIASPLLSRELKTFPCHSFGQEGDPSGAGLNALELEKQREAGVVALKSHGLMHPTSTSNTGCDVVMVVDFEDKDKGVALLMFECMYYLPKTPLSSQAASRKAWLALNGLLSGGSW